MQFTALQVATLIKGQIEGDPEVKVNRIAKIEEATEGALSFVANPKYEDRRGYRRCFKLCSQS
jgi:UDP-3-O-[3-hydroxymyristoyl] glucosamine N-acyltransferase